MKIIAMIPARFNASRLPGKLMADLGGKPVIVQSYLAVKNTQLFDEIIVVTDDDRIENAIKNEGGSVFRSQKEHQSGSDRLAEACENLAVDVIVNIQGDEPFTSAENLKKVIQIFKEDTHKKVSVASLMQQLTDYQEVTNPNNVKVVVNSQNEALYFSRAVIPFVRDNDTQVPYFKHIGIYAYRKEALLSFANLSASMLEKAEKLEQLRYLENGYTIKLALTENPTIGIDTPEDLEKARILFKEND